MSELRRTRLLSLHREIDLIAGGVAGQHNLHCRRGCSSCCVDDLTVFEVEAYRIRDTFPDLLETGQPGPAGACSPVGCTDAPSPPSTRLISSTAGFTMVCNQGSPHERPCQEAFASRNLQIAV